MTAPMAIREEAGQPEPVDPGYFDYQARTAFRDLVRLHGFEEARRTMAEIINDENDRSARQ